jgi:hypothetical protein
MRLRVGLQYEKGAELNSLLLNSLREIERERGGDIWTLDD